MGVNIWLSDSLVEMPLPIPEADLELAETTKDLDVIDRLSEHWDYRVRSRIAKKENIRIDTLIKLAKDTDYWVRLSVVKNELTPLHILINLINDKDIFVSTLANTILEQRKSRVWELWE